ncbi:hypothetical protein HAX54_044178 [Datura stramonium]|uniref:Uncharacterized protein n=1 Tax=Datura stramonium TaxID=4076 RepID=A0ABS8RPL2_DATST|nr:hypothetical protein [Datura stramonium]
MISDACFAFAFHHDQRQRHDVTAGVAFVGSVSNGYNEEISKAENGLNMHSNIKEGDELTQGSVKSVYRQGKFSREENKKRKTYDERMKALKKIKVAKTSSTSSVLNGSSNALLFTIFFFFVLLFQGQRFDEPRAMPTKPDTK